MTEIFILEANLRNTLGHFLNNTVGLKKAFESQNLKVKVLTHCDATKEVLDEISGIPVFRNSLLSQSQNSSDGAVAKMKKHGEQFYEDCCDIGQVPDHAVLLIPTVLEAQVYGLAQFLSRKDVPGNIKVILNFHWENVTQSDAHAAAYKEAFTHLKASFPESQILLSAHTPGIAKAIESVAQGLIVRVMPMPQYYGEERPQASLAPIKKPVLTVLGRSLPRKGSNAIMDLVYKLHAMHPNLGFRIQSTSTKGLAKWKAYLMPRITLFPGGMSMKQYLDNLKKADIFLLPYSPEEYSDRTSGVFAECAAMGGIAIVPDNTWLSRQIEAGRAAGIIYQSNEKNAIENAIKKAVMDVSALKEKAFDTADYWWDNVSAKAYVAHLGRHAFI